MRRLLITVLAGLLVLGTALAPAAAESDYERCDRLHPYDGTQAADDAFYECLYGVEVDPDPPGLGDTVPSQHHPVDADPVPSENPHQLTDYDVIQMQCNQTGTSARLKQLFPKMSCDEYWTTQGVDVYWP